jgi:hypothetical protein
MNMSLWTKVVGVPEPGRASSVLWGAQSSGSCLNIAFAWLAFFGPRPAFIFSTLRPETTWQQWDEGNHHHGLALFALGPGNLTEEKPLRVVPRKKPCQVSTRQWAARGGR